VAGVPVLGPVRRDGITGRFTSSGWVSAWLGSSGGWTAQAPLASKRAVRVRVRWEWSLWLALVLLLPLMLEVLVVLMVWRYPVSGDAPRVERRPWWVWASWLRGWVLRGWWVRGWALRAGPVTTAPGGGRPGW